MAYDDDAAAIIADLEKALQNAETKSDWLEKELLNEREKTTELSVKLAEAVRTISLLQQQLGETPY